MDALRQLATAITLLFVCGLYAEVILGMLTGRVRLIGLLKTRNPDGKLRVNPQRVQVLVSTLAAAGWYAGTFLASDRAGLPDIPQSMLALLGVSHIAYNGSKGYTAFQKKARQSTE